MLRLRLHVLRATVLLAGARFLVRFVPLRLWRSSLGEVFAAENDCAKPPCFPNPALTMQTARFLARCVERGARRLPGVSRCLPKAVALQWLLNRRKIHARTVIAFKISDRSGEDAYHAWVECDGEMLIGRCERASYRPIMILTPRRGRDEKCREDHSEA